MPFFISSQSESGIRSVLYNLYSLQSTPIFYWHTGYYIEYLNMDGYDGILFKT